jgi:hypothetical protein
VHIVQFLSENLKELNLSESLGVDGRIISVWILKEMRYQDGFDSYGSGYGSVAASREHVNEPPKSLKDGEHLD